MSFYRIDGRDMTEEVAIEYFRRKAQDAADERIADREIADARAALVAAIADQRKLIAEMRGEIARYVAARIAALTAERTDAINTLLDAHEPETPDA